MRVPKHVTEVIFIVLLVPLQGSCFELSHETDPTSIAIGSSSSVPMEVAVKGKVPDPFHKREFS